MLKTTPYDVADHLRTPAEAAEYLRACADEGINDASFLRGAMFDTARALDRLAGENKAN